MKTLLFLTRFELSHSFKTGKTWLFGLIFFLIAFLIVNICAGAFDSVKIMIAGENNKLNSPYLLSLLFSFLNLLGVILVAVLSGKIALKDVDHNSGALLFTTPVSKFHLLSGRFLAAFIISLFVFAAAAIGIAVGTFMPYLDQEQFGPFSLTAYLVPFFKLVVTHVFILSALFFALGSVYRNYFISWGAIILLYGLYYAAGQLSHKPEYNYLAGILDPFGIEAVGNSEVGQSENQLNKEDFDSGHVILVNRFVWIFIGLLFLTFTYLKFSFQQTAKFKKLKKEKKEDSVALNFKVFNRVKPEITFTAFSSFKQLLFLIRYEWSLLFRNFYFKVILLIGFILLVISTFAIGQIYDTNTYPVTYNVTEVFLTSTRLFLFVLITLFSGEMIWRERTLNIHYVGDTLPVKTSVKYFSKFITLTVLIFSIYLFFIGFGLLVQSLKGYTNYELDVYAKLILGIGFAQSLFTIALAFAVQAMVNNRFTGYFIMLAYMVFKSFLADSIFENSTFNFNSLPQVQYSDMNGFGYNIPVFILYKFYWLVFISLVLLLATKL